MSAAYFNNGVQSWVQRRASATVSIPPSQIVRRGYGCDGFGGADGILRSFPMSYFAHAIHAGLANTRAVSMNRLATSASQELSSATSSYS
jgi:hypothetical protein